MPQPGILRRCFIGPLGLRAGWRLLIFMALVVTFVAVTCIAGRPLSDVVYSVRNPFVPIIFGEGLTFVLLLLASCIMARIERRRVSDYGLPWRRMFRRQFWQGIGIGFISLSSLLLVMRSFGVFGFENIALHGAEIWIYGSSYALVFLMVALAEEFFSFGYALFTLFTGIGFWYAAILSSAVFGLLHFSNSGETWIGVLNTGLCGLLSCLLLRRTGDLWMAVGFHAAWDWGETYFYGTANSGRVTVGHLFNSSNSGSTWLSGGSVGPEGSLLCTVLLVMLCFVICALFQEKRFPAGDSAPERQPNLLPRKRRWYWCSLWTMLVLATFCSIPTWFAVKAWRASTQENVRDKADAQAAQESCVRLTISRETTYISKPLRKDGYPDYVAALDQQFSGGVTPENNAAVLFWKAVGPESILPEYRDKYFRMIGIPPLAEKGDYFVDLDKYLAQKKDGARPGSANSEPGTKYNTYDLLDPALKRPWSKQEFPVFAAWLAANEKPLTLLVEASKRPRRYDPLVCGEKTPLIAVLQPAISAFHHAGAVVSALIARAMLRLSSTKVDESWEDLLTCHRLARLIGQGPTVIDALDAQGIDAKACAGDQAFLQHTPLTAAQIARMREDLYRLSPMPKMADRLDVAERFTYLNAVSDLSREGRASLVGLEHSAELRDLNGSKELRSTVKSLIHYSDGTTIDWDLILRMGNSWFDRIADAYRKPTRAAQKEALRKLDDDFHKLKTTAENTASLDKSMLSDPRKALSERLGQVILIMFAPSIAMEVNFEDLATTRFELTKLAFALAAYHADHGSYPAKLADLTPKYVREVPKDIFSNTELHYRPDGKGYLLYSVGINGKDDGGKGFENGRREDKAVKNDWDDLVIRVPVATKQ